MYLDWVFLDNGFGGDCCVMLVVCSFCGGFGVAAPLVVIIVVLINRHLESSFSQAD